MTVRGAPAPMEHLALFLHGWPAHAAEAMAPPDIEVEPRPDGGFTVRIHGPARAAMECDSALDAANAVAGAAVAVQVARDPRLVCIHGAAALLPAGLVALVGESGAGKSSLALLLASAGHVLFGDDRVALRLPAEGAAEPVEGISVGLAPKMRLPLPPGCGDAFARYVEARTAYAGETAAYLRPQPGEAARPGARAALAAIVVLDRGGGEAALVRLGAADTIRALISHCFAPHIPAERMVGALDRLSRRVPVWRLGFAASAEAAALLAKGFARPGRDG